MRDDADPEQRIARSWIANAPAWTQAVRSGAIASRRAGTDAAIVDAVTACGARRVLDLGCGEGWLARALAARGIDVLGIDASAALVDAARAAGGARFDVAGYADIACGRFAAGAFDAVVFNFALLGEDLAPALDAARACLADGGTLLVQTVHPWTACGANAYVDGWRSEDFASIGGGFVEMPWYFRTVSSWFDALRAAGFAVDGLAEPHDRATGRPLSLLLRASLHELRERH